MGMENFSLNSLINLCKGRVTLEGGNVCFEIP